jgi:hypothetical protein
MKLYATTTSERATKGQGGNHIETTITDKDKNILIRFEVNTKDERIKDDKRLRYFCKVIDGDYDFLVNLKSHIAFFIDTNLKGERQKGDI